MLVYVLAYLLEAEMRMVRKCTIRAADEASNTQWAARGEALRTALESCDRSVVLEHIFTRAVGETGPSDANGPLGEYALYTNVSLKEAVGTVGRPAPETAHAELKAIREICKVAYRAAALEVAYRARRNTCMGGARNRP